MLISKHFSDNNYLAGLPELQWISFVGKGDEKFLSAYFFHESSLQLSPELMRVAGCWNISHPAVLQCRVMQKAVVLNGTQESLYDFLAQSNIPRTVCDILSICSGDEIRLNKKLVFETISIY
jgi:hypothetical protein